MGNLILSLSLSLPPPAATSRFCEAILDFLADEKRASEANIRAADFEGEAYSIYELFSTVWLQSKEAKVNTYIFIYYALFTMVCSVLTVYTVATPMFVNSIFL